MLSVNRLWKKERELFLLEEDGDFCFQLHDKMCFILQLKCCIWDVQGRLDEALSNLVWWKASLPMAGGFGTSWSSKTLPTWAILWFYVRGASVEVSWICQVLRIIKGCFMSSVTCLLPSCHCWLWGSSQWQMASSEKRKGWGREVMVELAKPTESFPLTERN